MFLCMCEEQGLGGEVFGSVCEGGDGACGDAVGARLDVHTWPCRSRLEISRDRRVEKMYWMRAESPGVLHLGTMTQFEGYFSAPLEYLIKQGGRGATPTKALISMRMLITI